jgi:hypothetical protein
MKSPVLYGADATFPSTSVAVAVAVTLGVGLNRLIAATAAVVRPRLFHTPKGALAEVQREHDVA